MSIRRLTASFRFYCPTCLPLVVYSKMARNKFDVPASFAAGHSAPVLGCAANGWKHCELDVRMVAYITPKDTAPANRNVNICSAKTGRVSVRRAIVFPGRPLDTLPGLRTDPRAAVLPNNHNQLINMVVYTSAIRRTYRSPEIPSMESRRLPLTLPVVDVSRNKPPEVGADPSSS